MNQNNKVVLFPDWNKVKLSKHQAEIFKDKSDRIFLSAGRFYGKDHILLLKALVKCFTLYYQRLFDESWDRVGSTVIMIFLSPTETNSEDLWTRVIEFLPKIDGIAPNGKKNIHVKHDARIIEIFGGEITISFETSTRMHGLRSRGCDILYINEGSYHSKQTLIDSIFPCCLRSGYAGIIYMSSSPKHIGHWWDQAVIDLHNKKGIFYKLGFALYQGNLYDNPKTTINEINALEAIKDTNPYSARREWLGWVNVPKTSEFYLGNGESLAFDATRIMKCKINEPVNTSGAYVIGVDLAGEADAEKNGDYLGVTVVDKNGVIVRLEKHSRTSFDDILNLLIRLNNTYRPRAIIYDENMGILRNKHNAELARMPLKPLKMNNLLKIKLVENLQHHMIAGSIRIPNPDMYYKYIEPDYKYMQENLYRLLKEMHEYRKFEMTEEYQSKGKIETRRNISFHKGLDGSDDLLDSCIMAFSEIPVPYKVNAVKPLLNDMEELKQQEQQLQQQQTFDIYKLRKRGSNFLRAGKGML